MFLRLILILQEVSRQKHIGYLEPARNSPGKLFFLISRAHCNRTPYVKEVPAQVRSGAVGRR